jgi:hypothetical protein
MKASHEITTANAASGSRARMHSFMIIAGIVTAIICSLVLLNDINSTQLAAAPEFNLLNISKTVITEQAMSVVSVIAF